MSADDIEILRREIEMLREELHSRPCLRHAEAIGELRGQASRWGAIFGMVAGALSSILTSLLRGPR